MRALIPLAVVVALLGCNGKTAPAEGQGDDVAAIRVCKGSPDASCTTFEDNFGMASDCTYLYSTPSISLKAIAPEKECSALLGVVRSAAFQEALKSPGSCGSTGEVAILSLASGATIRNNIAGCTQKPLADMRNAIDAVTSSYRPDGGTEWRAWRLSRPPDQASAEHESGDFVPRSEAHVDASFCAISAAAFRSRSPRR